jgi:hypothetical protein
MRPPDTRAFLRDLAFDDERTNQRHPADLIVQTFSQVAEIASAEAEALRNEVDALAA